MAVLILSTLENDTYASGESRTPSSAFPVTFIFKKDQNMKLIGVSEIGGNDTQFGTLICSEVVKALMQHGYQAKYLPLKDEFNCDISLNLSIVGTDDNIFIEVMHYGSMTACSKSKMKLSVSVKPRPLAI